MNFSHPIKGVLKLFKKKTTCVAYVIAVDSHDSASLNISLSNIEKGRLGLVLNWDYDEKQFTYNRSISIT